MHQGGTSRSFTGTGDVFFFSFVCGFILQIVLTQYVYNLLLRFIFIIQKFLKMFNYG